MAQKKSIVNLIKSDRTEGVKINGVDVLKVYRGIFQQDYSKLSSDSAYFYPQRNSFDAFGNVNINQGDTLNIYSDKLNYNGNTHIALLTDNVRMVDRDATLTTNYLTYNTATRIGTYTGGGKLVNKTNTLVSKNGYYFAFSRDAYFRYNVVLTTVDATIKTDTLRYNSNSRIAYFYGPTHILGKKDKDTLYTENGTYNTITEQAFFGKKNKYTQGSKMLKGDSLFYDRLKGYGRAVKNITFNDNEQKITMKGNLGTYYSADQRTVVTQNAYVIIVTEERDTTKKDTVAKSLPTVRGKPNKTAIITKPPANTVPLKNTDAIKNEVLTRSKTALGDSTTVKATLNQALTLAKPAVTTPGKAPAAVKNKNIPLKTPVTDSAALKKPATKIKRDSIYIGADTLETQIVTWKALKDMKEKMRLASIRDTSEKATKPKKKDVILSTSKKLVMAAPQGILRRDTSFMHKDIFGAPKKPDTLKNKNVAVAKVSTKKVAPPPLKDVKIDSAYMVRKVELSDTSRIRILSAHHVVKIFKSDLQAVADSMFYSYSDSTMRCYIKPMIWTQGSQISGDTINIQLKNKKLDNMDVFQSAFTVNIEDADSVHFNQVAGKKMRGFFVDGKMNRLFVDGNAESIYYSRDSLRRISGMQRSLSSRIRVNFVDNKADNLTFYTKPEHRYGPLDKFKEDDRILKGFIWKPKDRPASKASVIYRNRSTGAAGATKAGSKVPPQVKPPAKGKAGSTDTKAPASKPVTPDSKSAPSAKDSTNIKTPLVDTLQTRKPLAPDNQVKPAKVN
jgi:lipopolysaccharide export system protein LptA